MIISPPKLTAEIKHADANITEFPEIHELELPINILDAELFALNFNKNEYRPVQAVTVCYVYGFDRGVTYFEDCKLVRTGIETDLEPSDFISIPDTIV